MARNALKQIGAFLVLVGGMILVEPGFTNTIGCLAVLFAGMYGGYLDGKKAGARETIGGAVDNPIK